jgi:hypothetical protein
MATGLQSVLGNMDAARRVFLSAWAGTASVWHDARSAAFGEEFVAQAENDCRRMQEQMQTTFETIVAARQRFNLE